MYTGRFRLLTENSINQKIITKISMPHRKNTKHIDEPNKLEYSIKDMTSRRHSLLDKQFNRSLCISAIGCCIDI